MNEEQSKFAAEANIAVLATVDRRGNPHATPIWYLFDGGEFRISVGRGGQKHKNIEHNPEVTLVIDSRALPYYALMLHGRVEVGDPFNDADRLRLATRYLGDDLGKRYVEMTAGEEAVTLTLRPRKVIVFDPRVRI
jgi:PPOX class probable F420-dependent enzyme